MATDTPKYSTDDIREFEQGEAFIAGRGSSVRLRLPNGKETGLCTVTYSYSMTQQLKEKVAQRIVDMWNVNRGGS